MNLIRGLSNVLDQRLSNEFSKQKYFVLKTVFSHMVKACVQESARTRDMGPGM